MLVTLKQILEPAQTRRYAVVAPEIPSLGFTELLIRRAEALDAPLILSWAPALIAGHEINPPKRFFRLVRALAEEATVPLALHLDHGTEVEQVQHALDWGFTSVMIDASAKPYDRNVALTQKVVEIAHAAGVSVESELGVVGSGKQDYHQQNDRVSLTDPSLAAAFVAETGVDALAVAVGTVHGSYRGEPTLDFNLLKKLYETVPVPLVLHGGSGTGEENLTRAVSLGIRKINLYSEMMSSLNQRLEQALVPGKNPYQAVRTAGDQAVTEVVDRYIRLSNSAGNGLFTTTSSAERAIALFGQGYFCSEAVFKAFAEREGFTSDTSQLALSMLGGGLSNQGHVCGAVLGALAVIGARASSINPHNKPDRAVALNQGKALLDRIKETHISLDCIQLTGINFNIPEQAGRFGPERVAERTCLPMIIAVCEWLEKAI